MNETFSLNNGSIGIGADANGIITHEKSYTQLLSDNSRENYIPLKSNMNSKEHIRENTQGEALTTTALAKLPDDN